MALSATSRHLVRRHLTSTADLSSTLPVSATTVRRLARLGRHTEITSLLSPLLSPLPSESNLSSIISLYASAGMLDQATQAFSLQSNPSALSLNALLSPLNHHSRFLSRRIPDLFNSLSKAHSITPNEITYGILIKSLCLSGGGSKDAIPILKQMEEKNMKPNTIIYTTIIDSLYKEKKPGEAERIWNEMISKGISPDLAAYNVRIMYKSKYGKPEDVLALIEEMKPETKPDTITYNYLINSYCKHRRFDEAMKVYDALEEKGCIPNCTTYKHFLFSLCQNEDFDDALKVFNDGLKRRTVPDLGTVRVLVEGLIKQNKVRSAKRVVTGLRRTFPEDFVGNWKKLENLVGLGPNEEDDEKGDKEKSETA